SITLPTAPVCYYVYFPFKLSHRFFSLGRDSLALICDREPQNDSLNGRRSLLAMNISPSDVRAAYISGYSAKSRVSFPNCGKGRAHGSPGSDVDLSGRGRG